MIWTVHFSLKSFFKSEEQAFQRSLSAADCDDKRSVQSYPRHTAKPLEQTSAAFTSSCLFGAPIVSESLLLFEGKGQEIWY